MTGVRLCRTADLTAADVASIRRLMEAAFDGDFSDDDWSHALGGWHAIVDDGASTLAHASVVERRIDIGARPFRAGYVEAVAVQPSHQRTGLGTVVMTALDEILRQRFELGVLSTGEHAFYESLGWRRWQGPTFVRGADGRMIRTQEEDDGIMVKRWAAGPDPDLTAAIACDERAGDSW